MMTDCLDQAQAVPGRWIKGMPSPNPNGRPPGILDKRSRVTKALMDDAPAIARVVIDAAKEGDMQAAALVLARCAPVLKAQTEPVQFEFDATAPIAQQIEAVLAGIAGGAVPPDVGRQIIEAIGTLASVRATEELEQRIVMLEAKQV
ncbi:MAG: DUF5681 domain-containing protein [Novosphingobium sp.]